MVEALEIEIRKDVVHRPWLLGISPMAYVPEKAPNPLLHTLEAKNGQNTVINVRGIDIGGPELVLIAGSCSLENEEQMWIAADAAYCAGATGLRGGVLKPRTLPYSFQGWGESALLKQREIADGYGMFMITEATGNMNIDMVTAISDVVQVGARNGASYDFLVQLALTAKHYDKAVMLKRGVGQSLDEFLGSAEYFLCVGFEKLILCDARVSNLSETPELIKTRTHLPIIVDPTHSVKKAEQVTNVALSAVANNADGLSIEVHHDPENALSDGIRALLPEALCNLSKEIPKHLPPNRVFRVLN